MGIVGNKKTSDSHHFEVNVVVCPWTVRWTGSSLPIWLKTTAIRIVRPIPMRASQDWRGLEGTRIAMDLTSPRESTTTGAET